MEINISIFKHVTQQCPARVDIGISRSEKWNKNLFHSDREVKSEMKISFTLFENWKWKKNLLHFDREVKSEIQIWFTLFEKWKVKQKCLEIEIEKWNSREFFKSKTIKTFLSKMVSDDIGNAWYCIVLHSFAWLIRIDTIVVIWSDCHATGVGQSKILEKQVLGPRSRWLWWWFWRPGRVRCGWGLREKKYGWDWQMIPTLDNKLKLQNYCFLSRPLFNTCIWW